MIRSRNKNPLLLPVVSQPKKIQPAEQGGVDARNAPCCKPDDGFGDWPSDSDDESLRPFSVYSSEEEPRPLPSDVKPKPDQALSACHKLQGQYKNLDFGEIHDDTTSPTIQKELDDNSSLSKQQVSALAFGLLHDDMVLPSGRGEPWYDPFNPTHAPTNKYAVVRRQSKDPNARPKRTWSSQELINDTRLSLGLPPYECSRLLDDLAQIQAEKMAHRGYLSHSVHSELQLAMKVGSPLAGENILAGPSIYNMHKAMIYGSSPHWGNLLANEFHRVGVGTCTGEDGRLYMCQLFAGPVVGQEQQTASPSKKKMMKRLLKKLIPFW